jgi:hypothetical protein
VAGEAIPQPLVLGLSNRDGLRGRFPLVLAGKRGKLFLASLYGIFMQHPAEKVTDKPTRGRPPKHADQQTKPYSVRLTPERIAKLKMLKSAWLNGAIDRAKLAELRTRA